jgi:PAS domain S-box-containing protein
LALRLIGLIIVVAVVAGGSVGAVLIENSRSATREYILESNLAAADLAARFAANYVEGAETNVRQFAARPLFIRAVLDHDVEQAEWHLAQFLEIEDRFDSVAVYDAKGIGWASGLMGQWQNRGGTVADREWFQQTVATRKPYLEIPVLSRGTGRAIAAYAVPIFDDKGEMRAVLGGGISLAALSDAIAGLHPSAAVRASLVDTRQGGIILAHVDPKRILTPISGQNAAALRAVAGERGTMETRSSSGELDLAAFAPVPQLPWAVLILEPTEVAFAPVNALTQRALVLISITMLIAAVLGVLLARTITAPVQQLAMGAEAIGKGNLEYRIEVAARDEIGQLSQAFNQMTENLQAITASRDELNREITERKRMEDALKESEAKYRALFENAQIGMYRSKLDGSTFLEVNDKFAEIIGFSRQELLGSPGHIRWADPADREKMLKQLQEQGGILTNYETQVIAKNGDVKDVLASIALYPGAGYLEGTMTDITERKRAEEALAESGEKYRMLVEQTTDVIFTVDKDGRYRYVNTVFASTFGKTPEYFIGKTFWDIYPKEEADQRFETVSRTFQTGDIGTAEVRVPLADKTLWYLATSNPVKDSAGNIVEVLVYAKDITERKRAEDELQKLSLAVRYSNELVNLATPDGQMIFLNEAGGKILGIPPAEVCHTHIMQVIPAHLKERVEKEMLPTMMGGGTWSGDLQYTNLETGQLIDVFATTFAIKDQKTGKLLYFANVSIDITERKRAEEALRESEERFSLSMLASRDGIFDWNIAENRVYYSPSWSSILDETQVSPQLSTWEERIHPEDKTQTLAKLKKHLEGKGDNWQHEHRLRMKDGNWKWVLGRGMVVARDTEGKPLRMVGTMQDINERKRAEDALRESEEKFRGLTEGSAHGILAINLATMRFAYANPTACRMFGYSTQEMLEMDIVDVHPKDSLPHVLSEFRAKMAGGGLAADLPCLRKDGTVFYADVSGTMLSLQSQKCAVGFFVDVTERKRAEEALAESEEKYRMLVEQTTDVIFTVDKDGRYRYVNTVFASTFGKTPEYFLILTDSVVFDFRHAPVGF